MMKTFRFDFECGVCKEHRNRKREVLMCIFDENITDNITSYLSCHCCSEILEHEKIYSQDKYNKLCKAEKQIHCIFNLFDKSYQKLENNKKKKEYLKRIIERTDFYDNRSKLLMKKFINDPNLFIMLESYRINFILNTMGYFSFQYEHRMMETVTYRKCYEDYVINVFKDILVTYIENQIHLRKQNFDLHTIRMYIADQKL